MAKELRPWEHQTPWSGLNPNRGESSMKGAPSWEKESKRLQALGIPERELRNYTRKINSAIEEVDELNDNIIKKVNAIASCRRQYYDLYNEGPAKNRDDLEKTDEDIAALKREILKLQQKIEARGGAFERLPRFFSESVI